MARGYRDYAYWDYYGEDYIMNSFVRDIYNQEYGPKLNVGDQYHRRDTFRKAFEWLETKPKRDFLIVETGCLRILGNWADGQSTLLWDKFVNYYDGKVVSVDIEEKHCKVARDVTSKKTSVYCEDSVTFLDRFHEASDIDLLYLDSFDCDPSNVHPSAFHHMKELCAIYGKLSKGTMIMVDDTPGISGKGMYIHDFMNNLGKDTIISGFQKAWIR